MALECIGRDEGLFLKVPFNFEKPEDMAKLRELPGQRVGSLRGVCTLL